MKEHRTWRSLEELARTPDFEERLHREFPRHAAEWDESFDRRRFLQLSGAGLALAGLTGCTRQPIEQIVPYVRQPEQIVPGQALYFATARPHLGYVRGLLAESHQGRPTKLEGNPEHPASQGKSDLYDQASVLDLYDPDRSQAVTEDNNIKTWSGFVDATANKIIALQALGGEGLRILTPTVTSPSLGGMLREIQEAMPQAKWHQWESAGRDNARKASNAAFGEVVETRYDLSQADVVLAIDADLVTDGPGAVRYAGELSGRRRVHDPAEAEGMNRVYAVDSMPQNMSTVADHRLSVKPTQVAHVALAVAAALGVEGASAPAGLGHEDWIGAMVQDLQAHAGKCLVVAGDYVDAEVHVLVHAINAALGNVGTTVSYSESVEVEPIDQLASLTELVNDMKAGDVDTLLILGVNPVYDAPADLDFKAALENVSLTVHHGLHDDETALACDWQVPAAHFLESWGDGRAYDGTVSLIQPLINPLYGGKTEQEMLALLVGRGAVPALELVREYWKAPGEGFPALDDAAWRSALHEGVVPETAVETKEVVPDGAAVSAAASTIAGWTVGDLELLFRPDPTVFDGRFSNNGWLQECPKPLTRLTWDNALLMSPKTARDLGIGDLIDKNNQDEKTKGATVKVGDRDLDLPVWAVPGLADGTLVLHLGYGREFGNVATGAGKDAGSVRTVDGLWRVTQGVSASANGKRYTLASTQDHHSMEGRHIILGGGLDEYLEDNKSFHPIPHFDTNLTMMNHDDFPPGKYSWGMSIDLTACTGCNACVMACQSENNIPVVGKDQVAKGREMHWIRIDRYFAGPDDDHVEDVMHQPVICMHCEQAPCEVVCPVAATVHSDEGLNDMVYNRCVGTRYCSNNCPYKVRRFNFLLYQDLETPSLQLGRNPNVTVRSRGVMEKCTYCVQRISQARIEAKVEGGEIPDGKIQTACQQACPSDAIVFGDVTEGRDTAVNKAKASPLDYKLIEELGTRPRTTYLARVRNLNREITPRKAKDKYGSHGDDGHGAADSHAADSGH